MIVYDCQEEKKESHNILCGARIEEYFERNIPYVFILYNNMLWYVRTCMVRKVLMYLLIPTFMLMAVQRFANDESRCPRRHQLF